MKNDPKLAEIQKHIVNNDFEILKSKTCSCLFCRQTYDARKVCDWITDSRGVSAVCPECGMAAVVGDAAGFSLNYDELKELNLALYGEDFMSHHPDAAKKYILRYKEGKITHKKANEALYIQYLALLSSLGDADASYDLGNLYENGSEFTERDLKTAFSYYASNSLAKDGDALTRLGVLSESGTLGMADSRGAYECYAKAMAMGSMQGLVHFADCYLNGVFVRRDDNFAFSCLYDIWPECYRRFVASSGKEINIFPECSYRLGMLFLTGRGCQKDANTALRFFLYAQLGYQILMTIGEMKGEAQAEFSATNQRIEELAKTLSLRHGDPVFDNDTFADSLETDGNGFLGVKQRSALSISSFDKASGEFSFDVTYEVPPLIVDCGNLFCGFVPETIHWSFQDVSEVRLGQGSIYDHVEGDADEGWRFLSGYGNDAALVLSVLFSAPQQKKPSISQVKKVIKKSQA